MKLTSNKTDELNMVLTVNVEAEDYAAPLKKKINEITRNAEIPGFRKGKVPASLIRKKYGESILGEAVNDVISEALKKYITDEKLEIIGEPLPVEERREQEWKEGNDFTFDFDIALTPQVNLELSKSDVVNVYQISVSADDKKKMVDGYKKQQEAISEAAAKDGREAPAAKSDDELSADVDRQLEEEYKQASLFRLDRDIRDYCVKKADLQVPEKFLRRWLIVANEGKFTPEQIDKDFEGFLADYRWQLVMAFLTKKYGIKIEEGDLLNEARNFARYQFSMYGFKDAPDDQIEDFAKSMMSDEQSVQRMAENVQNRKVLDAVKADITTKNKKISSQKFREL